MITWREFLAQMQSAATRLQKIQVLRSSPTWRREWRKLTPRQHLQLRELAERGRVDWV
jgi:hypothetical protein